ncbi:MAG TPA: response regulator [Ruminiclostridium sp.]
MFRLFIVDDNKYERNGIKNSIDWEGLGVEVVGIFANAFEALDKIDELKPHIIITDIAMPGMNGIEMSERIKMNYPNIKIIFISCHSDFDYAKSAIGLGVYGYVLKPIISDELVKEVSRVLNDFNIQTLQMKEKERMLKQIEETLPMVQEQFFKELLLGNYNDNDYIIKRIEFLKISIEKNCKLYVISIKVNDTDESLQNQSVVDSYLISYSIKSIIASSVCENREIYSVQISGSEFAAILIDKIDYPINDNVVNIEQERVIDTAVNINMEISRRLNINTTMGISKCSRLHSDISLLYKQSHKAVNTRFYSGSNPIIMFEEIEDFIDNPFEEMPTLEKVYQDVKTLISFGTDQDISGFIKKYFSTERFKPDETYIRGFTYLLVNITGIILMESDQSFKDIFGDDVLIWKKLSKFDTIIDIEQWIYNIFKTIKEHLSERNTTKNVKLVENIKDIIKSKYHGQITIEDISKSVYLSGRHANSLFKKETGKTIFDYVIEYRIEVAKKLLKDSTSKVASVAEEVGYTNTSYFCLAFKKNVGMTPAEYKSKLNL